MSSQSASATGTAGHAAQIFTHKRTSSDEDDTYSTPPTSPMLPSPLSSTSSQTSEDVHDVHAKQAANTSANANAPGRRLSRRPSELQLKGTQEQWRPGVEVEAASPRAGDADGVADLADKLMKDANGADSDATNGQHARSAISTPASQSSQRPQPRERPSAGAEQLSQQPDDSAIKKDTNLSGNNIIMRNLINDSDSSSTVKPPPIRTQPRSPLAFTEPEPTVAPEPSYDQSLRSPCFVHSFLDKGASLTDWLRSKHLHQQQHFQQQAANMMSVQRPLDALSMSAIPAGSYSPQSISPTNNTLHIQNNLQYPHPHRPFAPAPHAVLPLPHAPSSAGSSPGSDFEDSDDGAGNLTRQLAETAVGVREMSKQLGERYFLLSASVVFLSLVIVVGR